ncbi:CCAAT-binding factor chain HAP5 like histone [Cryptosporidium ryanae]|uniref:CCAAT-binding factor chain HAP5 like histone n=1 Tax=Cryptosporidium ryanae TaxID=515981 RepID=UPI00351A3FD2|nr:CCAAT-binding factor chain HAP5 like histone [Cryptosporidium ryanae]
MFDEEAYFNPELYGGSQLSLSEYNVDSLLANNDRETGDYVNKNDYIKINEIHNILNLGEFESRRDESGGKYETNGNCNLSKQNTIIDSNMNKIHDIKLFSPFSTSSRSECSTNHTFRSPSFKDRYMKNIIKNNNLSLSQTKNYKTSLFTKDELKILSKSLPHTKIKRILKFSGLINNLIGSEVPALLAIACELFVRDLTDHAWNFTKLSKRRILQVQDIKLGSTKDIRIKNILKKSELKSEFIFEDLSFKNNACIKRNDLNSISPIYKTVTQGVESQSQSNTCNNSSFTAGNTYKHQSNSQCISDSYKNGSSIQYFPLHRSNIDQKNYDFAKAYVNGYFPN